MIAKRVKKAGKSDFRNLSRYVRDVKGNGDKVRHAWATNCADDSDIDLAEIEITATQDLNTRSKIDKTYHLVISLAPGEDLTNEQFREVEQFFCDAIGLSEHQRVCAIHSDTSSIHMHIAISKIHPLKLTAIEPYYDKYKLQDSCRELERRFDLVPGISEEKNKSKHQKEAFQKLQSFESYVKERFSSGLIEIQNRCSSWQEFQSELGKFNLEMRERGAGLVISHREMPLYVKASSIDRALSKQNLQDKFGNFEKSDWTGMPNETYRPSPTAKSLTSDKLYESYLSEKNASYSRRAELSLKNREILKEEIDDIKERYALQRLEVKKDTLIAKGRKRGIYQKLSAYMREEISETCAGIKSEIEKSKIESPVKAWRDWIFDEASRGNEEALGLLRQGNLNEQYQGFGEFKGERNDRIFDGIPRTIFKDGAIQYQIAEGAFIDLGDSIIVKSLHPKVIEIAQRCAEAKFGEKTMVLGSKEFLEKIQTHALSKVNISPAKNQEMTR